MDDFPTGNDLPPEADLLAWLDDAAAVLHRNEVSVAGEDKNMFLAIYGICAQTIRFATSYALLYRNSHDREGLVLARAALEHAVTAQWAFFVEGGLARLGATGRSAARRQYTMMGNYLERPEIVEHAEREFAEDGKRLPNITTLMRAMDSRKMLETHYMLFSQYCHVSGATISGFLSYSEEQFSLTPEPKDPNHAETLYVVSMAAMLAVWIIESLTLGQPNREALENRADSLKLPFSVRDSIDPSARNSR